MLFGYPIEIWVAILVSVLIKLKANKTLTVLGAITTIVISVSLALILYQPVIAVLGLSAGWEVLVAIIIALTIENILNAFIEISKDSESIKGFITLLITRRRD